MAQRYVIKNTNSSLYIKDTGKGPHKGIQHTHTSDISDALVLHKDTDSVAQFGGGTWAWTAVTVTED